MSRLQDQDFTYWFLSEAFGWDVVLQLVWFFDTELTDDEVTTMGAAIARGPLHRKVIRRGVPLARPAWVASDRSPFVAVEPEVVEDDDRWSWATGELETVDLDAEAGRCWSLRAVRTSSGGSVLSLSCLHLVADGRALSTAAAASSATVGPVGTTTGAGAQEPTALADLLDAGSQVVGAVRGAGRALGAFVDGRIRSSPGADPSPVTASASRATRVPTADRAPRARPSWAVVGTTVDEWDRAARRHGGTRNSLFVAVLAGALFRTGYADDGLPVKVGIPVSLRTGVDDDRGNATGGVSIVLSERPECGGDLTRIRGLCRDAFTALSAGRRPAMIHLQPLLQLLPLSVVTRLVTSGGSGMPDVVASNLGRIDGLRDVGSHRATDVAFRGTAQHVDPAGDQRFGEGIQSWCLEADDRLTFAVAGFDETRVGSDAALREALAAELTGWDVTYELR